MEDNSMEDYEMQRGTKKYNKTFLEYPHYSRHPQMMPFVGKYWDQTGKLLMIGESHYLDFDFSPETIKNWYNISLDDLDEDDYDYAYWWTNTARLIDITDYKSKGHTIWKNIDSAIRETGFNPSENIFSFIAYTNFFQRPAQKTGDSIIVSKDDIAVANNTLEFIISTIEPHYIFFVSSKSWQHYNKSIFNGKNVGHSAHPSCRWWNMKSSKFTKDESKRVVTGKESFMDFIIHNKIFG
jgi:hypothetical protein